MSAPLRLAIFDVDGTLVDSQAAIVGAMTASFEAQGLVAPAREVILGQVGLSLDVIFANLMPDAGLVVQTALADGYKEAFMQMRLAKGSQVTAPLYPGALDALQVLSEQPETLLGIATGKSKRGLDRLLEEHALSKQFVTQQVADFHPSKPHPSMLHKALAETGVEVENAVMIGDTSYDMQMAKSAGMFAIGVTWGYHRADQLTAADVVIEEFNQLHDVLQSIWG